MITFLVEKLEELDKIIITIVEMSEAQNKSE